MDFKKVRTKVEINKKNNVKGKGKGKGKENKGREDER